MVGWIHAAVSTLSIFATTNSNQQYNHHKDTVAHKKSTGNMKRNSEGEEKKQEGNVGIAARLARKNILELQPYRCARDDYSDGVLLDANENAYGPTLSLIHI